MNDEQEQVTVEERLRQIASAIQGNTQWAGQTTRELRDKVEITAKAIASLTTQIQESTAQTRTAIERLTAAIEDSARSSAKLSRWMVILTFALAVATAIAAAAAFLQWKTQNGQQPAAPSSAPAARVQGVAGTLEQGGVNG